MRKELKVVSSIIVFAVVGFVLAYSIYSSKQPKHKAPVASFKLPENLVRPDSPMIDVPDSSTTLIEFLDPECESCAAFYPIVKEVLKEYSGKVRFVVRYMPYHTSSLMAIAATESAGLQGKYWEMQELLFLKAAEWGHRERPDPEVFKAYAAQLGLDLTQFASDLQNPDWSKKAQRDMADGLELGVQGTPTLFVNQTQVKELSPHALRAALNLSLQGAEAK
jgi:protein-disulfide isomerase